MKNDTIIRITIEDGKKAKLGVTTTLLEFQVEEANFDIVEEVLKESCYKILKTYHMSRNDKYAK